MFLIVRCSPLIEYATSILLLMTFMGAITAFFASTTGAYQNDLKRVIAYSTCSQLGYMVFACGISSYSITMFHLMNHAFFKALLFLSAGAIIHAMQDEQDMRKMGGLNRLLPFTYTMTLIGSLALIGFPFLSGYYSKDFILEVACSKMNFSGNFAYWLGTISVSFTTFYSYRLVYMTFINRVNSYKSTMIKIHETKPISPMGIPLIILSIGSIFLGYLSKDMIIGLGTSFWGNSIFVLGQNQSYNEAEYLPYHIKAIPLVFSHIGIIIAYNTTYYLDNIQKNLLVYDISTKKEIIRIYSFFNQKWHIDEVYNRFLVQKVLTWGYLVSYKLIDAGYIAYIGPYGISASIEKLAKKTTSKIQTGYVYHYSFIILVSLILGTFFVAGPLSGGSLEWVYLISFYFTLVQLPL